MAEADLEASLGGKWVELSSEIAPELKQAAMTGGEFALRPGDAGTGTRARVEWRLVGGEVREPDAA